MMILTLKLVCLLMAVRASEGALNTEQVLRSLQKNANPEVRPFENTGQTLNVTISIYIAQMYNIDEQKGEWTMDMYFRRMWKDPRLTYQNGPESVVITSARATELLWIPDLFFSNSKVTLVHGTLKDDWGVLLNGKGDVRLSAKQSVTFHCGMALHSFPFDTQVCSFRIESYMFPSSEMSLQWKQPGLHINAGPAGFSLLKMDLTKKQNVMHTGKTYEYLQASFFIRRHFSHYVLLVIFPSLLLVTLAFLLFWLPAEARTERLVFAGFLLVSMVIISVASQFGAPQVGYMKALDVWCVACLLFIFLAIVQVQVLQVLRGHQGQAPTNQFELMPDKRLHNTTTVLLTPPKEEGERDAENTRASEPILFRPKPACLKLDMALRVSYVVCFMLFNITFWGYYS